MYDYSFSRLSDFDEHLMKLQCMTILFPDFLILTNIEEVTMYDYSFSRLSDFDEHLMKLAPCRRNCIIS